MYKVRNLFEGKRVSVSFDDEPSMTKQCFKEECDVNNILKSYVSTGEISHLARRPGGYGDVSAHLDYHDAMGVVMQAEEDFAALPAKVRARCQNDPYIFLEFINDPKNLDEMVQLGLVKKDSETNSKAGGGTPPQPPQSSDHGSNGSAKEEIKATA